MGSFVFIVPDNQEVLARLNNVNDGLAQARVDRGLGEHDFMHRPRPDPYDTTAVHTLVDGAGADAWGVYVQLIAAGAYDFGDSPNCIQIKALQIENVSGNDTCTIEFYSSTDGVAYTPLGAIRFIRASPLARTFIIDRPCRCYNVDANRLYARLKSAVGGKTVLFSLSVARIVHTDYEVPASTGVWPTG